jgi:ribosomal protein S18 acetylase RimI-like enzyme
MGRPRSSSRNKVRRRVGAATKRGGRQPAAATERRSAAGLPPGTSTNAAGPAFHVRRVEAADIPSVIALDERVTGLAKPDYWHEVFERFGKGRRDERMFLVAELAGAEGPAPVIGFVVGEVRAWEFGSAPCGWVFALSVEPRARLRGAGQALLGALSGEFSHAGVSKMRTMVARDNQLHLLFFRSEGMMAGPYIQLEKDLD